MKVLDSILGQVEGGAAPHSWTPRWAPSGILQRGWLLAGGHRDRAHQLQLNLNEACVGAVFVLKRNRTMTRFHVRWNRTGHQQSTRTQINRCLGPPKNTSAATLWASGTQLDSHLAPHPLPMQSTHQAHEEVAVDLAIVLLDLLLNLSLRKVRCVPLHRFILKDESAWTQSP